MTTILEAIEGFKQDLARNRKAQATIDTYGGALKQMAIWLPSQDINPTVDGPDTITTDLAMDFVNVTADRPISVHTLLSYITAVSLFLEYLADERLAKFEFSDWMGFKRRLTKMRTGLNVEELPRLPNEEAAQGVFDVAQNRAPKMAHSEWQQQMYYLMFKRDWAIVETLRATGARVHEVVRLKRTDLDEERKKAKIKGKGRKERMLYFDDDAWAAVHAYLRARDPIIPPTGNGDYLFTRHDRAASGKLLPLSTNAVRETLGNICTEAGVEKITPHQFRHRFATLLLEQTGDIALVQQFMGHASVQTTQVYAHVANERMDTAYQAAVLS